MTKTPTYTKNAQKSRIERLKAQGLNRRYFLLDADTDTNLKDDAFKLGVPFERVLIAKNKEVKRPTNN